MPNMVMMVLDDVNRLQEVLEVWHRQGARGVTVLESSGLARLAADYGRDDLPLFPSLSDLLEGREVRHRTLFTLLQDSIDLDTFFDATEAAVGRLDSPRSGIIVAWPVGAVRGLNRERGSR